MPFIRPAFKPHWRVEPTDEGIILRSERGSFLFKGKVYSSLIAFVDGVHSTDEIVQRLKLSAPAEHVRQALDTLEANGYLTDGASSLPPSEAAFWSALGIDEQSVKRLQGTAVDVIAACDVDLKPITDSLTALGIRLESEAPLHLVFVDDYMQPPLPDLNRRFFEQRSAWLIAKPTGSIPWLGPLFEPTKTACWECLAQMLRINRYTPSPASTADNLVAKGAAPAVFPFGCQPVLNLAALEAVKWLVSGRSDALSNQLMTFDLQQLRLENHPVVRRPQCPACGSTLAREPQIELASRLKTAGDNGYRTCSAEETLTRLTRHVSPITGIIASLTKSNRRRGESDSPVHTYIAWHRGSPRPKHYSGRTSAGFELSFGKGMSDAQAKVSCIAEALERYCCAYDETDEFISARLADLPDAIHPSSLLNFSDNQYLNRLHTNKDDDLFNWIPHRFDESEEIEWTKVWSLRDSQVRYVPSAFCFYYYPEKGKDRFCIANSNGCASGNTIEEAILQGLLELVERDAAAIWWYNRLSLPAVDIESFDDSQLHALCAHIKQYNRCLHVIDITHDLGVPTFAAVSWKSHGRSILFGLGTHLEAKVGVSRAITELSQRLSFAERAEEKDEGKLGAAEARIARWLQTVQIETQPYLRPQDDCSRTAADYTTFRSDDLLLDINYLVSKFKDSGLDTLVLNLTRPDVALPTARVIVPGLRHFWARFGPGRLYDVPVQLGWLKQPTCEENLNPVAYFL